MNERPAITDKDLKEQLEQAQGSFTFDVMRRHLEDVQRERDETRARRAGMTAVERRRDEIRERLADEDFKDEDRYHVHSVLALCGLPYRRPPDQAREYLREYGRNSLVVQAGYLKDPHSGRMESQGLPYGPKARLLMLHICTTALRQNNHKIEIADSMSAFIRDLGFAVTGGQRGTIAQFKEQLHRLAASRIQIGLWNGHRSTTINSQPIEAFDIWLPRDPNQPTLWANTLHLDQKFFQSLKEHALPVDIRVLKAFAHSARQIDIILWLAYRLRQVQKPYMITWNVLKEQFGADNTYMRSFKQTFSEDVAAIQEVFPKLPTLLTEKGLRLTPLDPEALFVAPKQTLPGPRPSR